MKNSLNLFLISPENSIKDSIIKIKKNGTRTLLVVKKNKFLLGTISEGDIFSALRKNYNLKSSIKKIFNKNPKKAILGNYNLSKISKILITAPAAKTEAPMSIVSLLAFSFAAGTLFDSSPLQ